MRKKEENIFMEYDKLGKLEKVDPKDAFKGKVGRKRGRNG